MKNNIKYQKVEHINTWATDEEYMFGKSNHSGFAIENVRDGGFDLLICSGFTHNGEQAKKTRIVLNRYNIRCLCNAIRAAAAKYQEMGDKKTSALEGK